MAKLMATEEVSPETKDLVDRMMLGRRPAPMSDQGSSLSSATGEDAHGPSDETTASRMTRDDELLDAPLAVVSVHGRGGESAGHGVCGGGVGGGWSSGLSAKVELRRFSPDREGDR